MSHSVYEAPYSPLAKGEGGFACEQRRVILTENFGKPDKHGAMAPILKKTRQRAQINSGRNPFAGQIVVSQTSVGSRAV
jgi:hypothetical protein